MNSTVDLWKFSNSMESIYTLRYFLIYLIGAFFMKRELHTNAFIIIHQLMAYFEAFDGSRPLKCCAPELVARATILIYVNTPV